jgi:cell division protease FtsH
LRPGRFDRQVVLDPPDVLGREQILKVHGRGKPLAKGVDIKILARRTPGFTGADLSNLLNEAALIAARADKREIEMNDLEVAIDKVIAGPEKRSRIMPEKEKQMTAYHEVGHALMCHLLENAHPLHKVTIIPRGFALGLTMYLPEEDSLSTTKAQIIDTIAVCLGGRLAEELIYGEEKVTTGAQNDLEKATKLSRRMVTEFGMSERLGPMTFGKRNEHIFLGRDFGHERDYGERVAEVIDEEVKRIITDQYERVKELLIKYRDHMDAIVKVLLDKETLDGAEFAAIMKRVNQDKGWEDKDDSSSSDATPPPGQATATPEGVSVELKGGEKEGPQDPPPELRPSFA